MPTNQDDDFKFEAQLLKELGTIQLQFDHKLAPDEVFALRFAYSLEIGSLVTMEPVDPERHIYELRIHRKQSQA